MCAVQEVNKREVTQCFIRFQSDLILDIISFYNDSKLETLISLADLVIKKSRRKKISSHIKCTLQNRFIDAFYASAQTFVEWNYASI